MSCEIPFLRERERERGREREMPIKVNRDRPPLNFEITPKELTSRVTKLYAVKSRLANDVPRWLEVIEKDFSQTAREFLGKERELLPAGEETLRKVKKKLQDSRMKTKRRDSREMTLTGIRGVLSRLGEENRKKRVVSRSKNTTQQRFLKNNLPYTSRYTNRPLHANHPTYPTNLMETTKGWHASVFGACDDRDELWRKLPSVNGSVDGDNSDRDEEEKNTYDPEDEPQRRLQGQDLCVAVQKGQGENVKLYVESGGYSTNGLFLLLLLLLLTLS